MAMHVPKVGLQTMMKDGAKVSALPAALPLCVRRGALVGDAGALRSRGEGEGWRRRKEREKAETERKATFFFLFSLSLSFCAAAAKILRVLYSA